MHLKIGGLALGFNRSLVPLYGSALAEMAALHAINAANPEAQIHLLAVVNADCLNEINVFEAIHISMAGLDESIHSPPPRKQQHQVFLR